MKKIPATLLFLSAAALAGADSLTISECYKLARENYPMIRQFGLIKESEKYDLENATSGYLPQFSISANAMYLSDSPEAMGQSLLPQEYLHCPRRSCRAPAKNPTPLSPRGR